jgi:hypothetical protein
MAVSTYSDQRKRVSRVLGALFIAVVLIGGAYIVSSPDLFGPQVVSAATTQQLLQDFAQQKGPDGRPLWIDELAATSSSTPATATSTPDDGTASSTDSGPQTLTDQFAQTIFTQYMSQLSADGGQPSDQDVETFADNAIQTLVQDHSTQDAYTQQDVKVQGSGSAALIAYAAGADKAISTNTANTSEGELDYFSDAVEKNDTGALTSLAAIGKAYAGLAPALMKMSVPIEAQYAHLEIANAAARLGEDITNMSAFGTDPLRAYIGLNAYETDAPALAKGFSDMATVFQDEDVVISKGDPGHGFYSILATAAATATSTSQ